MTPESQNVEWKSSWRDEHLKWICGFANAQGGVLGIGRNDCGEVVGVRGARQLLAEIPDKVQSLLGIVVDVDVDSEGGCDCLQIVVRPHSNPISYRGEIHYRSGGTRQVLSGAALSRFLMDRHGRTWDDVPLPGVDLEALDDRVLAGFRNRGVESERLPPDILSESDESVIEKLQLREAGFLKRAAVLLFHPEPHRFIMEAFVKIGFSVAPSCSFRMWSGAICSRSSTGHGPAVHEVHASLDFLRRRPPRRDLPGAARGHEGGGGQRDRSPGLRQPRDDSDSRLRRPDRDLEPSSPVSRMGRRAARRGTLRPVPTTRGSPRCSSEPE